MKQTEIIKGLDEAIRHIAENRHPEDEGRAMEVAEMLSKIGIAIASNDVQNDTALPFDKATRDAPLGVISFPITGMSLKGWKIGSIPMMYHDNVHALRETETNKTIAEVGGALHGAYYMRMGENSFCITPQQIMKSFTSFLIANPQYYDCEDKEALENFVFKDERVKPVKPKRARHAKNK